jgi:predicted Zn-dependent protease
MCDERCATHAEAVNEEAVIARTDAGVLVDLNKMDRRAMLRALATGALVVVAPGCATNMETGRSQLIFIDDASLSSMALQSWQQLRAETPVWRNPDAQRRLESVGRRIAVSANRPNDPWEFVVFDSPEKNAFVLPGGKVGYYRGLMEISSRDDHIATVLGHEVGHVTGRHAAERFSTGLALQGVVTAASISMSDSRYRTAAVAALGLGAQVGLLLPFSRRDELEADRLGVDYMYRAGYDPRACVEFWEIMSREGGGNRPPQWLSTHPSPETRINELRNYINTRGYARV